MRAPSPELRESLMTQRSPLLVLLALFAGMLPAQEKVDFNRDIRPLLSDRCFKCHGFDPQTREADLRLDTLEGLRADLGGVHAVVPGDAAASELVARIDPKDPDNQMPPPDSGLSLSADEKALIKRWIDEGAEYQPHWAWLSPPAPRRPETTKAGWARNELDGFILAELESKGLSPQPEADRETLARRVALDLTGLPPTPEELDRLLADEAPDAYERYVDRLLASPRFGERMAVAWLDVARYADTNGFHHDNIRTIWPYRNWVINAFNQNVPYDEFLVKQLAGDLLPEPSEQDLIATAFGRLHNINDEGGAIDDEYRVEAVADRIETVATALMGLTYTCARCHDHKYDPITQEDYFSLFAYFNSVDERGVYPNDFEQARAYPARLLYRPEELKERCVAKGEEVEAARAALSAAEPGLAAELAKYETTLRDERGVSWVQTLIVELSADDGVTLEAQPDGSVLASGAKPGSETHRLVFETLASDLRTLRLEALPDASNQGLIGRSQNGNAVLSAVELVVRSLADPEQSKTVTWSRAWANHEQKNGDFDAENLVTTSGEGWALEGHGPKGPRELLLIADEAFGIEGGSRLELTLRYESPYAHHSIGRIRARFAQGEIRGADLPLVMSDWWSVGPFHKDNKFDPTYDTAFGPESATKISRGAKFGKQSPKHRPDIVDGKTVSLSGQRRAFYFLRSLRSPEARKVEYVGGSDDSIKVFLNGKEVLANKARRGVGLDQERVSLELQPGENILCVKIINDGGPGGFAGRIELDETAPGPYAPLAFLDDRSEAMSRALLESWGKRRSPVYAPLLAKTKALEAELATLEMDSVPVLIMKELEKPVQAYVLERGRYDMANKERPVTRKLPAVLAKAVPGEMPTNRLEFARWLVHPENPLTARVHVNRIWQMIFGTGLVKTSENFGHQADWPSHPALLDWLARRFAEDWDQKELMRLITHSASYRQSSRRAPELQQVDPENRLLGAFPRRRLFAEFIRDQALFAAGLLVEKVGGPSVRPYQPMGLWREVSIGGSSNTQTFQQDQGEALYRRSLYTFWKRTAPSPQMTTFDAPTREFCMVRRSVTNTPLQALTIWNDPQFIEAARVLATRTLRERQDDGERVARLFRRLTSRVPDEQERGVLLGLVMDLRARFAAKPEDAKGLLDAGETKVPADIPAAELAAWTMLASTVLSLDETLVRD